MATQLHLFIVEILTFIICLFQMYNFSLSLRMIENVLFFNSNNRNVEDKREKDDMETFFIITVTL